jgi:hypothetical protein
MAFAKPAQNYVVFDKVTREPCGSGICDRGTMDKQIGPEHFAVETAEYYADFTNLYLDQNNIVRVTPTAV